ncbi:MAG: hypothetical protein Q7R54_03120 [bacterium]|nr:hypothetical protein [bacterium]
MNPVRNSRSFSNGVKKFHFIFLVILFLLPLVSFAQTTGGGEFVPLAPIPGLTDNQPQRDMALFLNNLYKFLIGFAAAAAVVMIIWGGLEYATQDSVSKKGDGKAKIQQAILGLVLVLMPVLVFSIINPSILNLSVNWKPITPSSVPVSGAPGGPSGNLGTGLTSCSISSGNYLQRATCTTDSSQQEWEGRCKSNGGELLLISKEPGPESCSLINGVRKCQSSSIYASMCRYAFSGTYLVINVGSRNWFGYDFQSVTEDSKKYFAFESECEASSGEVLKTITRAPDAPQPTGCKDFSYSNLPASSNGWCYALSNISCVPSL